MRLAGAHPHRRRDGGYDCGSPARRSHRSGDQALRPKRASRQYCPPFEMKSRRSLRFQAAILLVAAVVVVTAVFTLIRNGGARIDPLTMSLTTIQSFDNNSHYLPAGMLIQDNGPVRYVATADPKSLQPLP